MSADGGVLVVRGPAGAGGRVVVRGTSAFDSTSPKFVHVDCPGTTKATGGGGSIFGAGGADVPVAIIASGDDNLPDTKWVIGAQEMVATTTAWRVDAFVICAEFSP